MSVFCVFPESLIRMDRNRLEVVWINVPANLSTVGDI